MCRVIFLLLVASSLIGAAAATQAAAAPPAAQTCQGSEPIPQPLPLMEAVSLALCHNPDTRVAWAQALAQEAAVGVSRAGYYPTVTLSDQSTDQWSATQGTTNSVFATSSTTSLNAPANVGTLSLQYLIYDFGGRATSLASAKHDALASAFTFNNTVQQTVLTTVQSYYSAQSADAAVEAARQTLKFNRATQEVADVKHKVGLVPVSDKLQADTSVAQTELNNESLRQQAALSHGSLMRAMGLPPETEVALPKEVTTFFTDGVTEDAIDRLVREALKNRPTPTVAEAIAEANPEAADGKKH